MIRRLLSLLAVAVPAFVLSNCAISPGPANMDNAGSRYGREGMAAPAGAGPATTAVKSFCKGPERDGLATKYGEKIIDKIGTTVFDRDSGKPIAVAKIFYNDQAGAMAMAGRDWSSTNSFRDYAGGIFRAGLRNHRGAALSAYQSGENLICIGENGERYSVEMENMSNHRLEFVVTVDGLDVQNGQKGSFLHRGYVLDPGQRLEIRGWRTSPDEVAAFRFGKVVDGYAPLKTGDASNVGVIGAAVFAERGTTPKPYAGTDSYRRLRADPFVATPPGSGYATPPPR